MSRPEQISRLSHEGIMSEADKSTQPSPPTKLDRKATAKSKKLATEAKQQTLWSRSVSKLPSWCMKIKETRQQKLFFRCWLASWIAFILILPNGNLRVMGNAAFFAGIASLLMPVNMPVQTFLMAATILVTGCCAGWAWGCAAMRAAYSARDKALYHRTIQKLAQENGSGLNTAVIQSSIFHGDFLDTKSTAVFGVFLGLGVFFLGYVRASNAKLMLPTVFASIFLDVICSYGPLIPTPQYTILNTFVISTGYYVAIGLVLILVVFPQSLNHEWIGGANKVLTDVQALIELQEEVLTEEASDLNSSDSTLLARLRSEGEALTASFHALTDKTKMLNMEFSYGQLGARDLEGLELPLRNLVIRSRGLIAFSSLLSSHLKTRGQDHSLIQEGQLTPNDKSTLRTIRVGDTFRLLHVRNMDSKWEDENQLRIEDVLPVLESATENLRQAMINGVKVAYNALLLINTQRYKRKLPGQKKVLDKLKDEEIDVVKALQVLKTAIEEYQSTARLDLLEPYNHIVQSPFEVDRHGRPPFSLRPLFLCFVFQSNLIWTADAVKALLAFLDEAQRKRPDCQLWFPTGLNRILDWYRPDGKPSALDAESPPTLPGPMTKGDKDYFASDSQKDPDSLPPTSFLQKIGDRMHRFHMWLTTRETIYAFKFTVVTIALWLPQVIKRSAWFTYTERGLWGMIMGQMTLAVYMSDQISALKGRIIGTVSGGVLGMAAWYIGNGRGSGTPYGTAASAGLFLIPIVFYRLYGPTPMEAIMTGVTTMLVIGYSWIDVHLHQLGNLGVGWNVAWRRVLLVFIGSGASLILMLLPPQSLRLDVRKSNSSTIKDIARLYSMLLSTWLTEIDGSFEGGDSSSSSEHEEDQDHKKSVLSYAKWAPSFRAKLIDVADRLKVLRGQTAASKWEGSIRGQWPFEKYDKLVTVQTTMLNNLVQLSGALGELSSEWRRTLLHKTAFLNPNLITDVMAVFAIVAMSLGTGEAIHEVLPRSLIDRVYYHYSLGPHIGERNPPTEDVDDAAAAKGSTVHDVTLTQTRYSSIQFALYVTGCAAAYQILIALDELHRITKDLCGEVPLRGFEHWRREFEMKQLEERV